jgi:hypothetical protein
MRHPERCETSQARPEIPRRPDETELSDEFRRNQLADESWIDRAPDIVPRASRAQEVVDPQEAAQLNDEALDIEARHDDLLGHTGKRAEQREGELAFLEHRLRIVRHHEVRAEENRKRGRIAPGCREISVQRWEQLGQKVFAREVRDQDAIG